MHRVPILCFAALLFVPNGAWAQGEPLGPEFRVNTHYGYFQESPAVASDSSGNFVVVWHSGYEFLQPFDVFGRRYASTGEPLGGEFLVNTPSVLDHLHPAVASDSSGNFVVVWWSFAQDGSSYGVFGQRYASTGIPLGPEFRVNTYTMGGQSNPAVATGSSGNFVVVWQRGLFDLTDIVGQRYSQIVPSPSWQRPTEPVE